MISAKQSRRTLWVAVSILALGYIIQLFWYTWKFHIPRAKLGYIFIAFMSAIYYLNQIIALLEDESNSETLVYQKMDKNWKNAFTFIRKHPVILGVLYITLAICAILPSIFVFINYQTLLFERVGSNTDIEVFIGGLVLLPVAHATFKEFGNALGGTLILALLYARFGAYFPDMFAHGGFGWREIIEFSTVGLEDGVWGSITQIIATWVAMFVIWAGFILGFDGLDWIGNAGRKLGNRVSSGPVLTAIVSSAGFGMISGSGAANTAITGSFTIPLMKESTGMKAKYAAAVEGVSSTGGQITPPVMGVAIFLMSDILGIRLASLIVVATIPAILFYVPLIVSAHLMTKNYRRIESVVNLDAPSVKELLLNGFHIYLPTGILLYLLLIEQRGILISGVFTTFAMLLLGALYVSSRPVSEKPDSTRTKYVRKLVSFLQKFDKGLHEGISTTARIAMLGGAIGVIVRIIIITGIAQEVAFWMVTVGGDTMILLLILVASLAILIGMGSPPIAAYILTVLILAPSVVELGVPRIQAHFFVFYFAVVSYITPPVAISCAIACRIADSGFLETTYEAMKLGLPLYFLPFAFFYYNLIPVDFDVISILPNVVYVLICLTGIAYAIWSPTDTIRKASVGGTSLVLFLLGPVFIPFF